MIGRFSRKYVISQIKVNKLKKSFSLEKYMNNAYSPLFFNIIIVCHWNSQKQLGIRFICRLTVKEHLDVVLKEKYDGMYVPLNFFHSYINETMKKIFLFVLTDNLSVRRRLTDNLLVRRLLTDNFSVRTLLTDNLSVRRGLTDNLSVTRLSTDNSLVRRVLTGSLSVKRLLTDNLSVRRYLTDNLSVRRLLTDNLSVRSHLNWQFVS